MTASIKPLRLHGYPVSNYHNIVHAMLLEKGAPHEVVITGAAQDEAFLACNPMGKIPFLETPGGFIAETVAIIEYLEEVLPEPALLPADTFARARVRQLVNVVQVYIEGPCRTLYPGVFMGGVNADATTAIAVGSIDRAIAALARLVDQGPFLVGSALTTADIFAFHSFELAERVMQHCFDRSILDEAGLRQWHAGMGSRPSSRAVFAQFAPAFAAYLRDHAAAYRFEDYSHA